jgi:hypothetical protein
LNGSLPNSIQDENEMPRMGDLLKHRNLFQNLEFAFGDGVTSEQGLV